MDKKNPNIRVRIAPSPTGSPHLGTARTTLFNWLFARHEGGSFLLRIEDTDKERSKPVYEKELVEALRWLGVEWDEGPGKDGPYGPYRQSERTAIYKKYLEELLNKGEAYYCYCTKEELEEEKQKAVKENRPQIYGGKCRGLDAAPAGKKPEVIRFKTPGETVEFEDMIRGHIAFDMSLIGDFVLAKDLETPLYNFAASVDDFLMKISHVIRGEEHIANTPKQILLQRALGFDTAAYAHLPLILAPDKSKLSKRYTETSMLKYKEAGYLPEAMVNFIALLGWHPKEDREVLAIKELIDEFDLSRVQKAGAVFNEEKLNWLNSQHIKRMDNGRLSELVKSELKSSGIEATDELVLKLVELEKDRMRTVKDFIEHTSFFFKLPEYSPSLLVWKNSDKSAAKKNLSRLKEIIEALPEDKFEQKQLEEAIIPAANELGRGESLWPLRVALSGLQASPGPFEIMPALGKRETIERIEKAIRSL